MYIVLTTTKRRRSVGVRLVRKAKIFSGAGGRAGGLCCGGGRVGARANVLTNGHLNGRLEAHGNQARWPLPPLPDTLVFRQRIVRERLAGSGRVGAAVQPPLMPHDTQKVHDCVRSWAASTWVSALAALARGRRTCARALSARVWAWARAATKHGAANTAGWQGGSHLSSALGRVQAGFAAGKTRQDCLR